MSEWLYSKNLPFISTITYAIPYNTASIYPSATTCPTTRRAAQDHSTGEHNYLRNGAPWRVPKTFLSDSALRCLGFGRGLWMARCTQTARATDQGRASAWAECSIAQAPAAQVVFGVERKEKKSQAVIHRCSIVSGDIVPDL